MHELAITQSLVDALTARTGVTSGEGMAAWRDWLLTCGPRAA